MICRLLSPTIRLDRRGFGLRSPGTTQLVKNHLGHFGGRCNSIPLFCAGTQGRGPGRFATLGGR
jgi:hypothetical protein